MQDHSRKTDTDTPERKGNNIEIESFDAQLEEEPARAYGAYQMFRDMGCRRTIKGCMALHEIPPGKYPTWSRWARLYRWNERAQKFDERVAREIEKNLTVQRIENKKQCYEMLYKLNGVLGQKIEGMQASDISTMQTIEMLERSVNLERTLFDETGDGKNAAGTVNLVFNEGFSGL